jgi:hypothetical protein
MDNDLMARRLRPPSEPVQQTPQSPQPAVDQNAGQMPDWMPPAPRDDVPWDRPTDFSQPTDTASSDQPAWDRPAPIEWPAADSTGVAEHPADPLGAWPQPVVESPAVTAVFPPAPYQPADTVPSDPDDAYAPVLGDVNVPMARGWPDMNGHDNGRNDPAIVSDANAMAPMVTPVPVVIPDVGQPAAPAEAPAPVPPPAPTNWDEPTGMSEEWPTPEAPAPDWEEPRPAPEPPAAPSDTRPVGDFLAQGPTPPDDLFGTLPEPEPAKPEPASGSMQPSGESTQPDAPTPPEQPAPPSLVEVPLNESEHVMSPFSTAPAPPTPLVVRIELALVDGERRLVNPAEAARPVNPIEVEPERVTPRHPEFEPRGRNGDPYEVPADTHSDQAWIEPTATSVPQATPAPWAVSEPAAQPQPVDWGHAVPPPAAYPANPLPAVPWTPAPAPPAFAPPPIVEQYQSPYPQYAPQPQFAPPPAAQMQPVEPMPWTQPARAWDALAQLPAASITQAPQPVALTPAPAPMFAPEPQPHSPPPPAYFEPAPYEPSVAPQAFAPQTFAPPVYQEPTRAAVMAAPARAANAQAATAAQNQSDLWFLSTEPADAGESRDDDVADGKEPSPVLTAVLTIGMAVLVIVLVLVFIQLMTSLLR